jgi:hypothetical protein
MRRGFLATLVLLGALGAARADYVVIIANLQNVGNQPAAGIDPRTGQPLPGGAGVLGGGGMIGGGAPAAAGTTPAVPPNGMLGGAPPAGGMIGMRPNMGPMGGGAGVLGGFAGLPPPPPADADDSANFVVVVVEVTGPVGGYIKTFKLAGKPVKFHHYNLIEGNGTAVMQHRAPNGAYVVDVLENTAGRPIPSVGAQLKQKWDDVTKGKPTAEEVLAVAKFALEHGLLDKNKISGRPGFVDIMEKLAETEKNNTAVNAFLKVKEELARPLPADEALVAWKDKILINYKITQDDRHHYALVHSTDMSDADVRLRLDRLETAYRSFYYWWAMRGITLPVPKERLIAVLTEKKDDFKKLRLQLTTSPEVTDSFFARREVTSIFNARRTDEPYTNLDNVAQTLWEKGFHRTNILKGLTKIGYPRKMSSEEAKEPRMTALILRALEVEWEKTNSSHEVARQLMFATGLLPAKVQVPEWLQFGMGSFFEVPLQAPWGGAGAPSPYWHPRFLEYKYEASPRDTLLKVITDGYFRGKKPLGPKATAEERHERAAEVRKGRAAAWALTYFLAKDNLDGLQRYFKELSRMPRDVALDDKVLTDAFARAFDCVDASKKTDFGKLGALAGRWTGYIKQTSIEGASIHKKIRDYYSRMIPKTPPGAGVPGVIPRANPRPD